MVGDLEHVHGSQTRVRLQQFPLCGRFEIAGQQHAESGHADEKGDAGVVGALALPRGRSWYGG
ncbi:hypothetical protein GCM10027091_23500 [Streptomyces daliensis]